MNLDRLEEVKIESRNNNVPILIDESLELIEVILEMIKPEKVLEVGCAVGYSAMCFSKHLDSNGTIETIEINEEMVSKAKENIKYVGIKENVITIIQADATKYMKDIIGDGQYMVFLEEAIRLIKSGGVIIADNVLFKGRVMGGYNEHKHRTAVNRLREYIKEVKEDTRLISTILNIGDGVAISVKK